MYRIIVVIAVALLVAESAASPNGSRNDLNIEESSYQRTGSNQVDVRNSTQHRGLDRRVEMSIVQQHSSDSHNDTGNTRRIYFNGTIQGSVPINMDVIDDDASHDDPDVTSPITTEEPTTVDVEDSPTENTNAENEEIVDTRSANARNDPCRRNSSSSSENDGVSDETGEYDGGCDGNSNWRDTNDY